MPEPTATRGKIRGFMKLPQGWHYGSGVPPTLETVEVAERILSELAQLGLSHTDAFPGIEGEVMVTAYYRDKYLEFQVEIDHTVTVAYEENRDEVIYEENLTLDQALELLREIERKYLWALSGYFTIATTTPTGAKLKALPFKTQATEAAFPSLTKTALLSRVEASARTWHDFTLARQTAPPSSGVYRRGFYQVDTSQFKQPARPAIPATTTFKDSVRVEVEELSSQPETLIYEYA